MKAIKKGLTQWQWNKLQVLFKLIKGKYLESFMKDIDDFCENEGLDVEGLRKWT